MSSKGNPPAPFPEVNAILQELLESVKRVLGSHFIGMYLEGSLANGDFDQDSDIDFVVVTDEEVSENLFSELQAMHDQIATIDSWCAIQLEGSYISQAALRCHDPEHALHPNIERGIGERLQMVYHDDTWNVHRYILRGHGITLIGPNPEALIDLISPDELRRAMLSTLKGWATQILNHPNEMISRGYQSYIVLTLCRILYTLELGDVVSKSKAASRVKVTVSEKWKAFIDRAWVGRHQNPQLPPDPDDITQTLDFIRYVLERSQQVKIPSIGTLFNVPGCQVKQLQPEDTAALQALLEKSADYSQLVTGSPPGPSAAATLLTDCPPGKTASDKFVIGISTEPKDLVGVLDVIRDYPAQQDWWVGLLLFDPQHRGQGLGQQVYRAFERWVSQQGAQRVYLGVVEQNQRAYQFWQTLGFEAVDKQPARRFGNVEHGVIVMVRHLTKELSSDDQLP